MPPEPLTLDGLTADVPRAARFTARVQASRLLLLLASVLVIGLFLARAAQDLRDLGALAAHGQTAVAQIIGEHTAGDSKSHTYYVDYTFSAKGTQVEDEYEVGQAEYERPRTSGTLRVTFLPTHPQTNRLGAVTRERLLNKWVIWILRVIGVCVLLGALLTIREVPLRRHLSLLRDGSLAAGAITDCDKAPREGFFISYEFTVDGWLFPKKITGLQRFRERVEVGSSMAILYDPARASRNVPYRMMTGVALARPRQ